MKSFVAFIGRTLIAVIFILSGLSKIGDFTGTYAYMQNHGIPLTSFCLYVSIFIELVAGIALVIGYHARLIALVLFVYLIPVTYIFHFQAAFQMNTSVMDHKIQMIAFLKNLAIMGGLLMVYANGAGKWVLGTDS